MNNNIFEEVKNAVNIEEVIKSYGYEVNRAKKFICPFHADHKPSASIKNNYFNCFVCGTGGDAISFVAKLRNISNIDAAKEIIERFNLPIEINHKTHALTFREKMQREKQQRTRQEQLKEEARIKYVYNLFSVVHRYLFYGVRECSADSLQFQRGAMYLTETQYYLELIEIDAKNFIANYGGVIKTYEARANKWNIEK